VRVGVTDTGTGIPAEHLPHIWERFYKVDQARTRGAEAGVGLGLSIAQEIVRRMGGEVYVDSEAGRGSEFGFLLASGG
jgi:signal transduction histidine kinase